MIAAVAVRVVRNCAVGGAVLFAASFVATPATVQAPAERSGPAASVTRSVQEADRVAALLATHGCWQGETPAGAPEPGHAVVSAPGAKPHLVEASVGYGIWLDGDPGVLFGFCP